MIETDETCELEELFVRPWFRGRGFRRKLLDTMAAVAAKSSKLFLAWIPYADAAEHHLEILDRIFQKRGLTIHQTEERWAPYVAARRAGLDDRGQSTSELPPPAWNLAFVKAVGEIVAASAGAKAVVSEVLRGWVEVKNGKRTRIKVGDVEIEATQLDEDSVLRLLRKAVDAKGQFDRANPPEEAK